MGQGSHRAPGPERTSVSADTGRVCNGGSHHSSRHDLFTEAQVTPQAAARPGTPPLPSGNLTGASPAAAVGLRGRA